MRDFGFDLALIVPVGDIAKAFEITIGMFSRPGSAVVAPTPGYLSLLQVPAPVARMRVATLPHPYPYSKK